MYLTDYQISRQVTEFHVNVGNLSLLPNTLLFILTSKCCFMSGAIEHFYCVGA